MNPRLHERVSRLEQQRGNEVCAVPIPRHLMHAVFQALAVRIGGYPLPHEATREHDTISNGFARALGYVDCEMMQAAAARDPANWASGLDGAVDRLLDVLGVDEDTATPEGACRMWKAILDVCVASKMRGHDNASEHNALMGWLDGQGDRIGMAGLA